MWLPLIHGLIDRRILINYRVEPDALAAILPSPFRPQIVGGFGIVGICLIRLRNVRPRGVPRWLGLASENAAHRVAVQWNEGGQVREGVFVMRRDTNSRFNAAVGGRVFPGLHHHGVFRVRENEGRFEVGLASDDGEVTIDVVTHASTVWPKESVFASLGEASSFFEAGSLGYSPAMQLGRFQGLELRCRTWNVSPLAVETARSSIFDDRRRFPRGSVKLDCALLMQSIEHQWHGRAELCCAANSARGYAAAGSSRGETAATTSA